MRHHSLLVSALFCIYVGDAAFAQQDSVSTIKSLPCNIVRTIWGDSFSYDDKKTSPIPASEWGIAELDAAAERIRTCDIEPFVAHGNMLRALNSVRGMQNSPGVYSVEQRRLAESKARELREFQATQEAEKQAAAERAAAEAKVAAEEKAKELVVTIIPEIREILNHGNLKSQYAEISDIQTKIATLPASNQVDPLTQLAFQREAAEKLRNAALDRLQAEIGTARAEHDLVKKQTLTAQIAVEVDQLPEADANVLVPIVSELKTSMVRQIEAESANKTKALEAELRAEKEKSFADEQAQIERLTAPECRDFSVQSARFDKDRPHIGDLVNLSIKQHLAGMDDDACKSVREAFSEIEELYQSGASCLKTQPRNSDEIFSILTGVNEFRNKLPDIKKEYGCYF